MQQLQQIGFILRYVILGLTNSALQWLQYGQVSVEIPTWTNCTKTMEGQTTAIDFLSQTLWSFAILYLPIDYRIPPLSLSLPHKLVIQLFFLNPEIDLTDVEKKDGKGSNLSLVGHCHKMVRKELFSPYKTML